MRAVTGRMTWLFYLTSSRDQHVQSDEHHNLLDAITSGNDRLAESVVFAHIEKGRIPALEIILASGEYAPRTPGGRIRGVRSDRLTGARSCRAGLAALGEQPGEGGDGDEGDRADREHQGGVALVGGGELLEGVHAELPHGRDGGCR